MTDTPHGVQPLANLLKAYGKPNRTRVADSVVVAGATDANGQPGMVFIFGAGRQMWEPVLVSAPIDVLHDLVHLVSAAYTAARDNLGYQATGESTDVVNPAKERGTCALCGVAIFGEVALRGACLVCDPEVPA